MLRILSLDNEVEILELLHTILERAGYEHMYTTSTERALTILREGNIDLFTQNIVRNDMNGCEFYRLMQSEPTLKDIAVLIISSLDLFALPQNCLEIIAPLYPDRYLTMPFSPKQLETVVAAILQN